MRRSVFKIASILFLLMPFASVAQDTLDMEDVIVPGNRSVWKRTGLYDGAIQEDYNVRGYTQLSIFDGSLANFWTSEGQNCVSGKLADVEDNLMLKWNKDQDGCDWVGLGFGWDGWTAKDMAYVIDTLALELTVRSLDQPFTNLPWAFCFEDYSGGQAWLGYNRSFLVGESITKEWTKVRLPLQLFPFDENGVDATNIKQMMIQLFAEGDIEIQSIQLVPFSGKLKKEMVANQTQTPVKIDGSTADWTQQFVELTPDQKFSMKYTEDSLFFVFDIEDQTPRQNTRMKGDLWQGDAIEIAFSTNPSADPKRKFLLLSDQHIGINCGENSYVWDFKSGTEIASANHKVRLTDRGYILELAIPTNAFKQFKPTAGMELDIEIAIDLGTNAGRDVQLHWNSGFAEGFHQSPAKWGVLILE